MYKCVYIYIYMYVCSYTVYTIHYLYYTYHVYLYNQDHQCKYHHYKILNFLARRVQKCKGL